MQRTKVSSTNIRSIGYDKEEKVLEIEFLAGARVYQYFGVPEALYHKMMLAKSHGRFFADFIRNQFDYEEQ